MDLPYIQFADIAQETTPPDKGILSRTLYQDECLKVIIFGFAEGEELAEHTASMPAILQVLRGAAMVTLGGNSHAAQPGMWAYMPAGLTHSIRANSPMIMLLMLLKKR